jgi:hypothetical protein
VESRWGILKWSTSLDGVLVDPDGNARLVIGVYTHVRSLGSGRLLIWYESSARTAEAESPSTVTFAVVELDRLDVISDIARGMKSVRERRLPVAIAATSGAAQRAILSIPVQSLSRSLPVSLLAGMQESGELLFFVHTEGTRLWALSPADGRLEVATQEWFNRGDYDRGYQWPTRAARDPDTGRIVGDGIRIGTFLLNKSGTNVARWLSKTA